MPPPELMADGIVPVPEAEVAVVEFTPINQLATYHRKSSRVTALKRDQGVTRYCFKGTSINKFNHTGRVRRRGRCK